MTKATNIRGQNRGQSSRSSLPLSSTGVPPGSHAICQVICYLAPYNYKASLGLIIVISFSQLDITLSLNTVAQRVSFTGQMRWSSKRISLPLTIGVSKSSMIQNYVWSGTRFLLKILHRIVLVLEVLASWETFFCVRTGGRWGNGRSVRYPQGHVANIWIYHQTQKRGKWCIFQHQTLTTLTSD